ncbi:MAG: apolipoprotein N-acyltransferase [Treponema sp.]|nr:apolipoprotein N-acyltransferase [Treponema sp.]
MTLILQVFYSVFSGLLLTLGIPNELFLLGSPFYAFISIIPYYIAIKNAKNFRNAFLLGFLQTLTTHLCSSFWLAYFKDFAIFTLGASALATACIGGIMALFIYLPFSRNTEIYRKLSFYCAKKPFYEDSAFRIVYFASLYTLYEWVKSSGFIGYPWGTISSAMYRWHSFTQLASITGTYGITFLTVMFDCIVAEAGITYIYACKCHPEYKLKCFTGIIYTSKTFAILFAITLFWGNCQYNLVRTPDKTITTVMVQQNHDSWLISDEEETILKSEKLTQNKIDELRKLDKEPQLIVWSEGTLQRNFPGAASIYEYEPEENPLNYFIRRNSVPLITGGVYKKTVYTEKEPFNRYYNITAVFDSDANFRGYYGKLHLVPYAEAIPGIENPIIQKIFRKVVGISAGWTQGEQLTYFEIPCSYYDEKTNPRVNNINISIPYGVAQDCEQPLVRICTPICFDDSFTDVMRPLFLNGAELFVNLTDDSWSLKKSSEYQHFCIASYRAIEYRTTLVRSTNAGYSVVVDPAGKIIADQPLFEASSLAFDVPVYKRILTTYARFGNWLPYSCLVVFVLVSIFMACSFNMYDSIPSERNKPVVLRKAKKHKKVSNKKKKHKK